MGLAETSPQTSVPSCRRKRKSWLSAPGCGRPSVRCALARAVASMKSYTGRPEHRAVLVAQQLGHPLVDVGDDPAVVRDPDALLRRVHQLLEPLLALLQRLGPLLEPGLPRLEGRGVLERRADEPAEQPERLRVPVAEGVRARARRP